MYHDSWSEQPPNRYRWAPLDVSQRRQEFADDKVPGLVAVNGPGGQVEPL